MAEIKVSHQELGTVIVQHINPLANKNKLLIKSLAFLQLICLTPEEEEDENFPMFLEIVSQAAAEVKKLYDDEPTQQYSTTEQF
jgi:hypothetical protein